MKKLKKIGLWGQFGGDVIADGQAVRTRNVYQLIIDRYGDENVVKCSTYNWKKRPFSFLVQSIKLYLNVQNVVIFPADNGLKIIALLYAFLSLFVKRKKYYFVIGGFLPEFLRKHNGYRRVLAKYNGYFVQTSGIKNYLDSINYKNVFLIPNFKKLPIIDMSQKKKQRLQNPYRACVVSRITLDKGILDAISAIQKINKTSQYKIFLDFYGVIDSSFKSRFIDQILNDEFIKYRGILNYNETNLILSDYDFMIFPTYYYGEGFAGCIIDAFSAGLPLIASDWMANPTIIEDGKNGFIFKTKSVDDLVEKIHKLLSNHDVYFNMVDNNILRFEDYDGEKILSPLFTLLDTE